MNDIKTEAYYLAAVHLNHLVDEGVIVLPPTKEYDYDKFSDVVGVFHALVDNYLETLEKSKS